jgi:hypothetical protein
MNPGEYVQPLVRKTLVHCPVVSGYVTSRLYTQDDWPPPISGGTTATNMLVTFVNVGNTYISVHLRETSDRSVSGTRYNLTATPVFLVPGGQQIRTLSGTRNFLEVFCTGTTSGNLQMQIDSQRRWSELGFGKDDPYYPPSLFQAKGVPGPLT